MTWTEYLGMIAAENLLSLAEKSICLREGSDGLAELPCEEQLEPAAVKKAMKELDINPDKPNPMTS